MRDKRKVKAFLGRQMVKFCEQMNLDEPKLIFSDRDLRKMVNDNREFKDAKQSTLGLSWHSRDTKLKYNYVYLNLNSTDYVAQLIETLAHELVHIKYPNLKHSDNFYNKVNSIMIGERFE